MAFKIKTFNSGREVYDGLIDFLTSDPGLVAGQQQWADITPDPMADFYNQPFAGYTSKTLSGERFVFGTASLPFANSPGDAATSEPSIVDFGVADFCIEFQAYTVHDGDGQFFFDTRTSDSQGPLNGFCMYITDRRALRVYSAISASDIMNTGDNFWVHDTWHHVVLRRSEGVTTLYVDGTAVSRIADSRNHRSTGFLIGAHWSRAATLNGFMDEIRVCHDDRYPRRLSPPSSAPVYAEGQPHYGSTKFLLDCEGTAGSPPATDAVGVAVSSGGGTPVLSTDVAKFGSSSLRLQNNNSAVRFTPDMGGNNTFTVEFFFYCPATVNNENVVFQAPVTGWNSTGLALSLHRNASNRNMLIWYANTSDEIGINLPDGVWHHIAITHDGTDLFVYANGMPVWSWRSGVTLAAGEWRIGGFAGQSGFSGYVDSVRVLSGVALYTDKITPQTTRHPVGPADGENWQFVKMLVQARGAPGTAAPQSVADNAPLVNYGNAYGAFNWCTSGWNNRRPSKPPACVSTTSGNCYTLSGKLSVPVTGSYQFALDCAGAATLAINSALVVGRYGSAGFADNDNTVGTVMLAADDNPFVLSHVSPSALSGIVLRWKKPGDAGFSDIPLTSVKDATERCKVGNQSVAGDSAGVAALVFPVPPHRVLRGPGAAGADKIYVALQYAKPAGKDYYLIRVAGLAGWNPGAPIDAQPGGWTGWRTMSVLDLPTQCWFVANGRRFIVAARAGSDLWGNIYAGFLLPYATPQQHAYPMYVGSNCQAADYHPSDRHWNIGAFWFPCNKSGVVRTPDGIWRNVTQGYDYNGYLYRQGDQSGQCMVGNRWRFLGELRENLDGSFPLLPFVLTFAENGSKGVIGELDGVFQTSARSSPAGNLIQYGGIDHLVAKDNARSGWADCAAIALA